MAVEAKLTLMAIDANIGQLVKVPFLNQNLPLFISNNEVDKLASFNVAIS